MFQQGYLAEAISAYNQAIRVNPTLAEAHNHLGLALYQQGNVREAIRAYSRAVQLEPKLEEAHRNLDTALRKQGVYPTNGQSPYPPKNQPPKTQLWHQPGKATHPNRPGSATQSLPSQASPSYQKVEAAPSSGHAVAASAGRSHRKPLLWLGIGTVGFTGLLLGGWLLSSQLAGSLPKILAEQPPPSVENIDELKRANPSVVAAIATQQFDQGNIQAGQRAIEVLLERKELTQAAAALTPILSQKGNSPTINFLMGRLAWEFVQVGNSLYHVEDARHAWEKAANLEPGSIAFQNALGFAYYAEGNLELATQTWLQALQLADGGPTKTVANQQVNPTSSQETLTAYAGLAMVLMKKAEKEPPRKGAIIRSEAINLRRRVLAGDSANFKPESLEQNWLWSKNAVEDWEKLLSLKQK
ncbi:tetratricopeptide repeat protein [Kovacikia minuta CCNUW1]|uniref:tetratricopeptide repeat protein n=1 Tax=Kovacikia minuta TaxID=2931930 RepID=UPI001CCA33CC|nr:tetratricopeptide repeat protein [Kovacikia minuta]UBF27764.1 tetratricopeptide repeat protein [Kovacikia minuta CCNUW1]